jgi:RimJ/RimL family protein N-acetyltransferase
VLAETIKTKRLILRRWRLEDANAVYAYAADEEWLRYLPLPVPYTRGDADRFVAAQVLLDWEKHPSWAIEHDGTVRGGVNLRFFENGRIGELGYAVDRSLWGGGIATEAVRAVIEAAFASCVDLDRVRAMADARNAASLRVLEKVGMTREGLLRANRYTRGEPVDEVWYGLLRKAWQPV